MATPATELPQAWADTLLLLPECEDPAATVAGRVDALHGPATVIPDDGRADPVTIVMPGQASGPPATSMPAGAQSVFADEADAEPEEPAAPRALTQRFDHAVQGAPPPPFAERFRILRTLGKGGMGEVVAAEQRALAREVAIKLLREDADASERAAFAAEARIAARLRHPHVVPVHDAGDGYLVMRRVQGETLAELARRAGQDPAALPPLITALIEVCETVAAAHAEGVLHRDLKLANIMVGPFGEVWVLDWGLAVPLVRGSDGLLRAHFDDPDTVCAGTPTFLSPECAAAEANRIGPASDLFLLGACLYRLLTGRSPYHAVSAWASLALAVRGDYPRVASLNPRAPARLIAAQEQAMQREPDARGSVAEFAAALRAWLHSVRNEEEAARALRSAEAHLDHASRAVAEALREARSSGAATTTKSGATTTQLPAMAAAYRAFTAAAAGAHRAEGLCPSAAEPRQLSLRIATEHARAALQAGDLALADTVIDRLADLSAPQAHAGDRGACAAMTALRQELDAALAQRDRHVAARQRAQRLAVALALLLLVGLLALLGFIARSGERAEAERRTQAADLLARAESLPMRSALGSASRAPGSPGQAPRTIDPAISQQIALARRALGLDPRHAGVRRFLATTAGIAAEQALHAERLELAAALIEVVEEAEAQEPGLAAPSTQLAAALRQRLADAIARSQGELRGRLQRWREDLAAALGSDAAALITGGPDQAAAVLARWDGPELLAVLGGMVDEGDVNHRRVACLVHARRDDLPVAGLRRLLADPDALVREAACLAALQRADPGLMPDLRRALRQEELAAARRLGARSGTWLHAALRGDRETTPEDLLRAGDALGFLEAVRSAAVAPSQSASPTQREQASAIALVHREDPALVFALLASATSPRAQQLTALARALRDVRTAAAASTALASPMPDPAALAAQAEPRIAAALLPRLDEIARATQAGDPLLAERLAMLLQETWPDQPAGFAAAVRCWGDAGDAERMAAARARAARFAAMAERAAVWQRQEQR